MLFKSSFHEISNDCCASTVASQSESCIHEIAKNRTAEKCDICGSTDRKTLLFTFFLLFLVINTLLTKIHLLMQVWILYHTYFVENESFQYLVRDVQTGGMRFSNLYIRRCAFKCACMCVCVCVGVIDAFPFEIKTIHRDMLVYNFDKLLSKQVNIERLKKQSGVKYNTSSKCCCESWISAGYCDILLRHKLKITARWSD